MDVKMLIFLAVVVAVLPSALSIQCYQCKGDKNCTTEVHCDSRYYDTCTFGYLKSDKSYTFGCSDKKNCEKYAEMSKKSGRYVMKCCQTDLCNKDAPAPSKPSTANTQQALFIVSGVLSCFSTIFYLM